MRRVHPSAYTHEYYLTDCTGYREFKKKFGLKLEPRLARITAEMPLPRDLRVLDIGCGRGEMVAWAARKGASHAEGVDYSTAAVLLAKKAQKNWPKSLKNRTNFRHMDAKKLKFPDASFDAVFLVEVLEHLYPEEQVVVMHEVYRVLKSDGFVFAHTAPSRWFNDYSYRVWSYPISSVLVGAWNKLLRKNYGNLLPPDKLRSKSHKIMHVAEPDYFSLKKLFADTGFFGGIGSTNITVLKPVISWKDTLFNFIVYLHPFSKFFPLNVFFGADFYAILRKK